MNLGWFHPARQKAGKDAMVTKEGKGRPPQRSEEQKAHARFAQTKGRVCVASSSSQKDVGGTSELVHPVEKQRRKVSAERPRLSPPFLPLESFKHPNI